jgi:hypothetical protein
VRAAATIVSIAAASPTTSSWISCSGGEDGMWGSLRNGADTALTPV